MPHTSSDTAPAVEAALSMLETLGAVHQMGMSELARKLDLSKGSVYRLLATLVRLGYVEKNPQNDRYQLTVRLFAVGSVAANQAHATARGKVLLAALEPSALAQRLGGRRLARLAENVRAAALEVSRRLGYAVGSLRRGGDA